MGRRRKWQRVPHYRDIKSRKRPDGVTVFQVRLTVGDKSHGRRFTDCADAVAYRDSLYALRRHRRLKASGVPSNEFPLGELWRLYITDVARTRRASTVRCYAEAIRRWWRYMPPTRTVASLKRDHWREFVSVSERQISSRSINLTLTVLRAALKWGVREGVIASNPLEYVRGVRQTRSEIEVFTQAEADAICAADDLWRLYFDTGLRLSEGRALEWRNVDFAGGWLHVRPTDRYQLKNAASERSVPLTDALRDWLLVQQMLQSGTTGDLVLLQPGGAPYSNRQLIRAFHRACKAAGVDRRGRGIHAIRHTRLTAWANAGLTAHELRALSGHASTAVLDRYVHVTARDVRAKLEARR